MQEQAPAVPDPLDAWLLQSVAVVQLTERAMLLTEFVPGTYRYVPAALPQTSVRR